MGGHHRGAHAVAEQLIGGILTPTALVRAQYRYEEGRSPMSLGRHRATSTGWTLDEFNAADPDSVAQPLRSCLDIPEWVEEVVARRPYPDVRSLYVAGWAASADLTWEQVSGALDRHPRIGEQKAAAARSATESAWSASEQSGVQLTEAQALAEGNRTYEERFGHIFLICASGLSGDQILAELRARLANDVEAERLVVVRELRKIADLRLRKAVPE